MMSAFWRLLLVCGEERIYWFHLIQEGGQNLDIYCRFIVKIYLYVLDLGFAAL